MPYAQYTFNSLADQLGNSLDDPREFYWTRLEKFYALSEAFRVWGAYTAYWRSRGPFDLTVGVPYYDLSVKLPTLRPRTYTLQNIVQEIQYHCLEAPNGVTGTGMSGQINLQSILKAVTRARNRFVIDSCLPLQVNASPGPADTDGLCVIDPSVVYIHRAGWLDNSGVYNNLWRQDEWGYDKNQPLWQQEPGRPESFSEALNAPLSIQLYPTPLNAGALELITANSIVIDTTQASASLNFPDEWVHGIKYAALNDLFGSGMLEDSVRAEYCETRYQQAVSGIKNIRSINRVVVNGVQVPLDTFAAIDAGNIYWRNQSGRPLICGAMNDFLVVTPVPNNTYGALVDVVQSAPIPTDGNQYVQIGQEEIDNIMDYCINYLMLKCGGKDMQDTFTNYDSFMSKVDQRKASNDVKIIYLELIDQPAKEERERPTMSRPKRNNDPMNKG